MPSIPGLNLLPEIKCDVKVLTRYILKFSLIEAISVPSSILMAMSSSLNLNILPMLLSGKMQFICEILVFWILPSFLYPCSTNLHGHEECGLFCNKDVFTNSSFTLAVGWLPEKILFSIPSCPWQHLYIMFKYPFANTLVLDSQMC